MPWFAKCKRRVRRWGGRKIKCPTTSTVDLVSESHTAVDESQTAVDESHRAPPLDSLPAELKLQILALPLAPRDFENLVCASPSFYRTYKLNRNVIATAMRLNELAARGIHMLHLPRLSIAYLEYWSSSPGSPHLEAALRSLLERKVSAAANLPPEQRTVLRNLGALIGWSVIPTKTGRTAIKMSMCQNDERRVKDHGCEETNYRLLCLVEPGTEADFEIMKTRWSNDLDDRCRKLYWKGKQLCFDKFGRELAVEQEPNGIEWSSKKLYWSDRGPLVAHQVA